MKKPEILLTLFLFLMGAAGSVTAQDRLNSNTEGNEASGRIEITPLFEFKDGSTGVLNEGEATLFKIAGPGPFDTIRVMQIENDKIVFDDLESGAYIVHVSPAPGYIAIKDPGTEDMDSVRLIPTFFKNAIDWQDADTLQLTDIISDTIWMQRATKQAMTGEAVVMVSVEFHNPDTKSKVSGAGCTLRRKETTGGGRSSEQEYVLFSYKETDDNGEVFFEGIPSGWYKLNIHIPGIPLDPNAFQEFEISESDGVNRYDFFAFAKDDIITIGRILATATDDLRHPRVYPNPAGEEIIVDFGRPAGKNIKVRLLDLTGKVITEKTLMAGGGKKSKIRTNGLNGVYILEILDETEDISGRLKVVVRN